MRILFTPPLLRRHVLRLEPEQGDYILGYVATHGHADLVRSWHAMHPDVWLHCFYDRSGAVLLETVERVARAG